jgi:SP family sugar:H+ symporter-like MFS transporter
MLKILNGLHSFLEDFGFYDTALESWNISTSIQNALTLILLGGAILGSLLSGPIGTYLGRRCGLFTSGIVSIIGVLLQITSVTLGTLLAGRFLTGSR